MGDRSDAANQGIHFTLNVLPSLVTWYVSVSPIRRCRFSLTAMDKLAVWTSTPTAITWPEEATIGSGDILLVDCVASGLPVS